MLGILCVFTFVSVAFMFDYLNIRTCQFSCECM